MSAGAVQHRDLVAIGGSAGGIEAVCEVVAGLPADLSAAVLVVMHLPAQADSALPAILDRCGPLPAQPARHDEPLLPGRVYVAVPDHHLLVRDGYIMLSRAAKQNWARPAVDALFRSVARWRARRSVGVLLSGSLDDGAAGLAAIDAAGGACVVQDPDDALFSGMPRAALTVVPNALVGSSRTIGTQIEKLVAEKITDLADDRVNPDLVAETEMAENHSHDPRARPGEPAAVSCPDCSGGMNRVQIGTAVHYTCHVGHVWSPQTLLAAQREKIEQALWTAVSMLEEQAGVHDDLAGRAARSAQLMTRSHQQAAAQEIRTAAGVIRKHFPEFMPMI